MGRMNSGIAMLFSLVVIPGLLLSAPSRAEAPAVDPAAVQALQKMTDYVSTLQQFRVHTQSTLEDVLDSGQRIDYDVAARVAVRRPDRVYSERLGQGVNQVFFYDGKSLTLFTPADNTYAADKAPKTIEEMIDFTREELGLLIPVSDLIYRNAYAILMEGVTAATVVGKSMIGEASCTHLAFRRPDVEFQIWVADAERPLPCKYVVTDTSTPELISTVTVMSDWDFAPLGDAVFNFQPPRDARKIDFIPLDKTTAFGN